MQSVLLRFHALTSLRKAFTTAGRAIPETTMKDIIKYSKNVLVDKALPVQRAAADVRVQSSFGWFIGASNPNDN